MYCCTNCFDNKFIIKEIQDFDEFGDCSYCGSEDVSIADVGEIGEFIRSCLEKGYVNATTDDIPYEVFEEFNEDDITTIYEVLCYDEAIFSEKIDCSGNIDKLLEDLFSESGPSSRDIAQGSIDDWEGGEVDIILKGAFYALDFNSYRLNWEDFKYSVKHINRFFDVNSNMSRESMLNEFDYFFEKMEITLPKGTFIWRGRKDPKGNYDTTEERLKESGPPPRNYALPLRMNPAGISYFYGAADQNTCFKEIRADANNIVIYGLFKTKQELKIIDLSQAPHVSAPSIFSPDYNHDMNWARDFLRSFVEEISKPINEEITHIEYIPTQILSEYIRMKGYDGVRYKSSITGVYNYTLFCGPAEENDFDYEQQIMKEKFQVPIFTTWLELVDFQISS